jgi:hypothetical protein
VASHFLVACVGFFLIMLSISLCLVSGGRDAHYI